MFTPQNKFGQYKGSTPMNSHCVAKGCHPQIQNYKYDEESDHSNKAVRKTPEIESGLKVSEEVK